jgi:hypothetical protein
MMGSGGMWEQYTYNIYNQRGEESFIESKMSNAFVRKGSPNVLESHQAGINYRLYDFIERVCPLLLAHWDGIDETTKLPGISIDKINETQPHSLMLNGDLNLYDQIWAKYFYWNKYIRRDGTIVIQWPKEVISTLPLYKKFKTGSTKFLVKSIAVDMDHENDQLTFGDSEIARC